jgi:UDP-galactopyranose mutase
MDYGAYEVIIVGCGLSGAVIAERFASVLGKRVLITDKRDHIGGNCYDFVDELTGIRCSKYGPHFFHTNHEDVWEYIQKFGEWVRYEHRVLASVDDTLVPVPVNITTVNTLCNTHIRDEKEMDQWLQQNQIPCDGSPKNSEEVALSLVGKTLYEKLFKSYTFKQWAKFPAELKSEVLARIPVRNNLDGRYFSDKYQVLPKNGYTQFFQNMLDHPKITVKLNTDFFHIREEIPDSTIIIYTGPIDKFFADSGYEPLEYRSIDFVFETHRMNYYQPSAQVNYPQATIPFTRITEYKHCLHQKSDYTIISKEYSTDKGEPYYPVLNAKNLDLFEKYKALAEEESKRRNIHFLGRLANYKYFNMDAAIKNSLDYFKEMWFK